MCAVCELRKMGVSENHVMAAKGFCYIFDLLLPVAVTLLLHAGRPFHEYSAFRLKMHALAWLTYTPYGQPQYEDELDKETAAHFSLYTQRDYAECAAEVLTATLMYCNIYSRYCDPVMSIEAAIHVAEERAAGTAGTTYR